MNWDRLSSLRLYSIRIDSNWFIAYEVVRSGAKCTWWNINCTSLHAREFIKRSECHIDWWNVCHVDCQDRLNEIFLSFDEWISDDCKKKEKMNTERVWRCNKKNAKSVEKKSLEIFLIIIRKYVSLPCAPTQFNKESEGIFTIHSNRSKDMGHLTSWLIVIL